MDAGGRISRNVLVALGLIAVATAIAIGIAQAPDSGDSGSANPESAATEQDFEAALADAPPRLAAIYEQGDALLDGGLEGLDAEIAKLHGFPVVVNAWGSWCAPCRAELPHFQQATIEFGARVAFLGVNTEDSEDAARTFLEEVPLPFPSYQDFDGDVRSEWHPRGLPATRFYDASGEVVHLRDGPYLTLEELEADIRRYAS
jgi:cytochrome c biogenesis protein CcmG, thiol:disulfide interchange protein DsbE